MLVKRPPKPPPDPEGMPAMTKVESDTVYAIGYEDQAHMLFVRFRARGPGKAAHPGDLYRYVKVPRTIWTRFQRASSFGSYLATHVKGKFGYSKWTGSAWRPQAVLRVLSAQARRARVRERSR